ncbi:hypothetical protein Tco_0741131 [Tanacetum coccineum]
MKEGDKPKKVLKQRDHGDDQDEDPSAGSNQGKKTKKRRFNESESSKNTSTTKESSKELGINALALSDRHPTYYKTPSDQVKMDNPNITMKEYIRLEEEKARRCGKIYNWETAKYGKIGDNEDVHDLGSVENEFPAIVFNDTLTPEALLCEPTVRPLNNDEIDFRISFDESNDEDCASICLCFYYPSIYVNDLKTDSENDNEKVNMPSFPPPKPTVSCFDDLDFFKDFENEFPAIVYINAQTSKSDLLTEPILIPQHIDEFNLKDEISFSKCDKEEQNVLNFNDLFPFNVIYPNDSKSDKDNDDDKVDIEHSSGDLSVKPLPDVINTDVGAYAHGSNKLLETRPSEGKSTNIGGEFTNLEILKCWSLETSRRLFNTILLINSTWRIYRANIKGVSHSNSF